MLNENDVLITIITKRNEKGNTDYRDIANALNLDMISLLPFMKALSSKGYITQTLENVTVTRLGLLACKK